MSSKNPKKPMSPAKSLEARLSTITDVDELVAAAKEFDKTIDSELYSETVDAKFYSEAVDPNVGKPKVEFEGSEASNDSDSDPFSKTIELTEDHCRAVTDDRICGNPQGRSRCSRVGHSKAQTVGDPGVYGNLGPLRQSSTYSDGDVTDYQSFAEAEQETTARAKENQAIGSQPEVAGPFARSPFAKKAPTASSNVPVDQSGDLVTPNKARVIELAKRRAEAYRQVEAAKLQQQRDLEELERQAAAEAEEQDAELEAQRLEADILAMEAELANLRRIPPPAPQPRVRSHLQVQPQTRAYRPVSTGRTVPEMNDPDLNPPAPDKSAPLEFPGGQDPGYKTEEVYGIAQALPGEFMCQLVGTALPEDVKSELHNLLPDVIAPNPGTFTSAGTGQEELTSGFLSALENHTNAVHQKRSGLVKVDSSWNSAGRVALYKVKTQSDFNRLLQGFQLREKSFQSNFGQRVRAVLIHYGLDPTDARSFSESSRYVNISLRANDLYGRLLFHLDRAISTSGFKSVKPIIDLFATSLVNFREDMTRTGMWLSTYVYLRNLYQSNYWSVERQEIINQTVMTETDYGHDTASSSKGTCNHCQGHPAGVCPFKNASIGRKPSRRLAGAAKAMGGKFTEKAKLVIKEYEEEQKDDSEG